MSCVRHAFSPQEERPPRGKAKATGRISLPPLVAVVLSLCWAPPATLAQGGGNQAPPGTPPIPLATRPPQAPSLQQGEQPTMVATVCTPDGPPEAFCPGELLPIGTHDQPFVLDLPAFNSSDPTLGELQKVEINATIECLGGPICISNITGTCCTGQLIITSSAMIQPSSTTGIPPLWDAFTTVETFNYALAPNDQDDSNNCLGDGSSCDAGDSTTWLYAPADLDSAFQPHPITITDPTDLLAWQSAGPGVIPFEVEFVSDRNLSGCTNASYLPDVRGKICLTVKYFANLPPTCPDAGFDVCEDSQNNPIPLLAGVIDPDGQVDCSSLEIVGPPAHGTLGAFTGCGGLDCQDSCTVPYTPVADYCGPDSFTFRIADEEGASTECTVTIEVLPVNDPPVCVSATPAEHTTEVMQEYAIPLDPWVHDPDADSVCAGGLPGLMFSNAEVVDCPNVVLTGLTGSVATILVPAGFCNPVTIGFDATDSASGGTGDDTCWGGPFTVHCEAVALFTAPNHAPVAAEDCVNTCEDEPVTISILANDHDPDESGVHCDPADTSTCPGACLIDPTSIELFGDPGVLSRVEVLADGTLRFTPLPDECGTFTFGYKVSDTCGEPSNLAAVHVCVNPVNDPPLLADDDAGVFPEPQNCCDDNAPLTITIPVASLTANDVDPDADGLCGTDDLTASPIEVFGLSCAGTLALSPDGTSVLVTLDPDFCGPCSFQYRIETADTPLSGCDFSDCPPAACPPPGPTSPATVSLLVSATNDPPAAYDDEATTEMNVPVVIEVLLNDCDPDGSLGGSGTCGDVIDPASITITTPPTCPGASGAATATPNAAGAPIGTITFMPPPDYVGDCTFQYDVSDLSGVSSSACRTATVTVHITPPCVPNNLRTLASLLVYPIFDNTDGVQTVLTMTNVSAQDVVVHAVFIDGDSCQEFDRDYPLSGRDTLTATTNAMNPNFEQGYIFAYVTCNGQPVANDVLAGQVLVLDGVEAFSYTVNAFGFQGIGDPNNLCGGYPRTDVDFDGVRDLDGIEYTSVPEKLLFPRFFGQDALYRSEIVLIGLTGGAAFETTVDLVIYNDNEVPFSGEHTFSCWDRRPLIEISNVFTESFLDTTFDDPEEILGDTNHEAGWLRVDGAIAQSINTFFEDPAVLGFLIESTDISSFGADLPWGLCSQENGALLQHGNDGGL